MRYLLNQILLIFQIGEIDYFFLQVVLIIQNILMNMVIILVSIYIYIPIYLFNKINNLVML